MRRALDIALAVGLAASGWVTGNQDHPPGWAPYDVWAYLLTGLTALPLAARRIAPMTVLLTSCAACTTYLAAGYQPALNWWAPPIALVSLAGRGPLRRALAGALPAVAVLLLSGISMRLPLALVVIQAVGLPGVCLFFGRTQRTLAQRNAELARLARRPTHEQGDRARHAVVDERVRIARELHDVVAHHLSVISVQAGLAAYVFASDPRAARAALTAIADVSRGALSELRRLLSALRLDLAEHDSSAPPLSPLPGLGQIDDLVERVRGAGVAVRVRREGVPRRLAPGLELCAYRVIQEALTNVIKHAGRAGAELSIGYLPDRLCVVVRDEGKKATAVSFTGSGPGLIGMRERVRVCGGELSAGARPDGGFEVRFTLPTGAAPRGE